MILDEIKKASITALREKDPVARSIYGIISNKAMLEIIPYIYFSLPYGVSHIYLE